MNGSVDLDGVHGTIKALDFESARPGCRFQTNDGGLLQKMRWSYVFMMVIYGKGIRQV